MEWLLHRATQELSNFVISNMHLEIKIYSLRCPTHVELLLYFVSLGYYQFSEIELPESLPRCLDNMDLRVHDERNCIEMHLQQNVHGRQPAGQDRRRKRVLLMPGPDRRSDDCSVCADQKVEKSIPDTTSRTPVLLSDNLLEAPSLHRLFFPLLVCCTKKERDQKSRGFPIGRGFI
jgi:hypothetical protein